jgi:hypothetical protein
MVAGMSARNPIPRTSIQRYYKKVCGMSYAQRLTLVDSLLEDPSPLVKEFESSAVTFSSYNNPEGFYSNPKRAPKPPEPPGEIVKTHHVAWYLRRQQTLKVDGAPELNARYVDYEIAPARTTDHAAFNDDGGSWRTGVFIDLLLANGADSTPIVGELKIRADKDPFTALVQVLACAAHLATPHQYERLRQFAPTGHFPARGLPLLDGYVLLYRFLEVAQADLEELGEKAEQLSVRLLKHPEIAGRLRRIECLDLEFGEGDELRATKRWQHDGGSNGGP